MRAGARLLVVAMLVGLGAGTARADDLSDARAKSEAGDHKAAEASYRKALALKPDPGVARELAAVLYNQAVILGRQGTFGPTVGLLKEALELAPDLQDARVALTLSYDKLGKKQEAAQTLSDIGAFYLTAAAPSPANAAKAQQAFVEARTRDDRPEYWVGEGDARLVQRDFHGALAAYRKVEGRFPKGPGLHRRMGDAYDGLGLAKQAEESYEKAAAADTTAATSMFLAKHYASRKQWDLVIAKAAEAEKKGASRDAELTFLLANAWYLKGLAQLNAKADADGKKSLEACVAAIDASLSKKPSSGLLQIKGLALLLLQRWADGAAALEAALQSAGGASVAPQVYQALAAAYEKLGKPDKAAEILKRRP